MHIPFNFLIYFEALRMRGSSLFINLEIFIFAYVEIVSSGQNGEAMKALDFSLDNDGQSDQSVGVGDKSKFFDNFP